MSLFFRYEMLSRLTKTSYSYQASQVGDIKIYILGFTSKTPKFGTFIDARVRENLDACLPYLSIPALTELKFALLVQSEINKGPHHYFLWKRAFHQSQQYFRIHRDTVLRVSNILNLFCPGHDLTKTKLVIIALGFCWHWEDNTKQEFILENAMNLVKICHLQLEDHHPQCEDETAWDLLFCDRISVHMQKSTCPIYEERGFDLDPKFIPPEASDKWLAFKQRYIDINLWDHTRDILHKFDIDTDIAPQTVPRISNQYSVPPNQFKTYRRGKIECDCMDDVTKTCCVNQDPDCIDPGLICASHNPYCIEAYKKGYTPKINQLLECCMNDK